MIGPESAICLHSGSVGARTTAYRGFGFKLHATPEEGSAVVPNETEPTLRPSDPPRPVVAGTWLRRAGKAKSPPIGTKRLIIIVYLFISLRLTQATGAN